MQKMTQGADAGRVSRKARDDVLPYLLIAPAILFLALLFLVPLVQTIALSFTTSGAWSLGNYARMTGDLNFGIAIRNTFMLVIAVIPLQVALALGMGLMLQ